MQLLAEQVLVECSPSRLEELLSQRPLNWLTPLLRLAGDAGEAAGLTLLGPPRGGTTKAGVRTHLLETGATEYGPTGLQVPLHWRTRAYQALFARFDGMLEVRSLSGQTVLSLEGSFIGHRGSDRTAAGTDASRRAAEFAARTLLGHLRTAVEYG